MKEKRKGVGTGTADAASPPPLAPADKVVADTARYEALAREHGADLSEEEFNEALRKTGIHKSESVWKSS